MVVFSSLSILHKFTVFLGIQVAFFQGALTASIPHRIPFGDRIPDDKSDVEQDARQNHPTEVEPSLHSTLLPRTYQSSPRFENSTQNSITTTEPVRPHKNVPYRCNAAFFHPRHFNASGTSQWYTDFTTAIDKTSPEWIGRVGEIQYFAQKKLNWVDADCGVSYRGCRNLPTCDEIVERVNGDMEEARRIYFVLRSAANMNLIGGVVSVCEICQWSRLVSHSYRGEGLTWASGTKPRRTSQYGQPGVVNGKDVLLAVRSKEAAAL